MYAIKISSGVISMIHGTRSGQISTHGLQIRSRRCAFRRTPHAVCAAETGFNFLKSYNKYATDRLGSHEMVSVMRRARQALTI